MKKEQIPAARDAVPVDGAAVSEAAAVDEAVAVDSEAVPVDGVAAADSEAAVISDLERCTRQHALSAERSAKCHSSHRKDATFSARIATRRKDRRDTDYPIIADFLNFFCFCFKQVLSKAVFFYSNEISVTGTEATEHIAV